MGTLSDCADFAHDLQMLVLHRAAGHVEVAGGREEVQLQRVDSLVGELAGVLHPCGAIHRIQARDHRDFHGFARFFHPHQVFLRSRVLELGEDRGHFTVQVVAGLQVLLQLETLELDLFLEETLQHDGPGARLFHPLDAVHVRREVTRSRHDRVCESESHEARLQAAHRVPPWFDSKNRDGMTKCPAVYMGVLPAQTRLSRPGDYFRERFLLGKLRLQHFFACLVDVAPALE